MAILITGATGKLGSLIIEQLLKRVERERLIACVRRLDKATRLRELGIEVRQADYDDPLSLERSFADGTKLLFISSPHTDDTVRVRQHSHVIEAAKKANITHVVYTSFAFLEKANISLTHLHMATEHAIRTTGIPYTFLRNGLYSDVIAAFGIQQAIETGELLTYPGKWSFHTVTREDLSLAAATVISTEGHENQTYELTASRAWNFAELAEVLTAHTDKSIRHREDPVAESWLYRFLMQIDTSSTTTDLERIIGKPTASLEQMVMQIMEQA
ncbi:SDR family oxidoreductase [Brevibacillus porteri]|uniref:NAD(P)-dependent oxidoreductase n=1 Tax=Brevibacillus porteri TaxID=2126350 RepID=A0ABX5FVB6_9BACL|nr:SDR family oxidoreductase [Brevibacillus porteri]MED1797395.1 SDR family oxidoreductase [Brevibacillus porteri]MED2129465.1 SDR family oxidoreductase [Brevibacillus porteri]MED2747612.1 SDR family oxidoreductase [Brevibacillus porteri]MED2817978.1 SDR family oxidoreductase [Brevibacillus porteri]MED2897548.1 SDR family oxidoreductase [Brevibacillus porteri]